MRLHPVKDEHDNCTEGAFFFTPSPRGNAPDYGNLVFQNLPPETPPFFRCDDNSINT